MSNKFQYIFKIYGLTFEVLKKIRLIKLISHNNYVLVIFNL